MTDEGRSDYRGGMDMVLVSMRRSKWDSVQGEQSVQGELLESKSNRNDPMESVQEYTESTLCCQRGSKN